MITTAMVTNTCQFLSWFLSSLFFFFFFLFFFFFFFTSLVWSHWVRVLVFWPLASCLLGYELMLFTTIHESFLGYAGSLFWMVCMLPIVIVTSYGIYFILFYSTLCIRIHISLARLVISTFLTT